MMQFLAFFASLTFLFTVYTGQLLLIFASGTLLCVLVVFVSRDLAAILKHLHALGETKDGPVTLAPDRDAIFPAVERGITGMEGLAYRLNALEWQIHHLSSHGLDTAPTFLPKEVKEESKALELEEVFQYLLQGLSKKLRADGAAVVVFDEQREPNLRLSGLEGSRFEHTLKRLARAYSLRNQVGIVGHRKTEELPLLVDELQFFGVNELITMPFDVLHRHGLIILTYRAYHSPTEVEKKLLRYFVRELETEVPSLLKMRELTGRVSEAETLSKEKSDFLAQMSHDIRSPLNNIKASLNFLKTLGPDAESEEIIDIASANCDSLTELLTTILDFSRHQAGKLESYPTAFDIVGEMTSLVDGFKVTARLQGIELKTEYPRYDRPKVLADRTHTKRIVSNLLSNAIKFTERGRVTVRVDRRDSGWVSITVQDSGCGMSKSQLQQLFVPFTRFQGAKREGIGLGLAVTKLLTERNNGRIEVESEQDVGTQVTVLLRDATVQNEKEALPPDRASPDLKLVKPLVPARSFESVLVVDDDPATVRSVRRTLEHAGFKVLEATSVSAAVSLINFGGADCLVTDLHLTDGTARDILAFLRSRKISLPTCVVSGETRSEVHGELLALGATEVFEKPLDAKALIQWLIGGGVRKEVA